MASKQEKRREGIDFFLQERADIVGLKPEKGESTDNFRRRVAGALRSSGHIIEAHEALPGKLYDDSEQGPLGPMSGIIGFVAQQMQGISYSSQPERQVEDDVAAGALMRAGEDPTEAALRSIFGTLGVEAGMDFITGTQGKVKGDQDQKKLKR